jgi:hypothetical protein
MTDDGKTHDPMWRSHEAVARAQANDRLMQQVREAREARRRGERGTPGRAFDEELKRRKRPE